MATEQQKTTYTAAEVAVLEETILKQKAEIDELKRKLEHMNEVFANAQRARFGQSSEKNTYAFKIFCSPAFLRKVPHNTTKAKRAKNGNRFSKKFFSHLVGSENAILSRLTCKHFMNLLPSALSVL